MKSFLYHGFGIKGYRYLATRYEKGEIIIVVEPEAPPPKPKEGKWVKHGLRWRKVRTVGLGLKAIWLKVKVPRWFNPDTGEEIEQSPPLYVNRQTRQKRSKDSLSK